MEFNKVRVIATTPVVSIPDSEGLCLQHGYLHHKTKTTLNQQPLLKYYTNTISLKQ